MSTIAAEVANYQRGRRLAEWWIESGGETEVDGPYFGCEALHDGFVDRLAEEHSACRQRADAPLAAAAVDLELSFA